MPSLDLTIYEKNSELGGTCPDVPSHAYRLSFESFGSWLGCSHFFSGAKHVRFQSRCIGACWNDLTGKWFGQAFEDSAVVLTTGLLNEWKWPSIPGLHSFKGKVLRSASWDESYDIEGKQVAIIVAVSSGIQIVPALLDKVIGMDHYIRGKAWISNQHGGERLSVRTARKGGNFAYTEDENQAWARDTAAYIKYRKELELEIGLQRSARAQYTADMEHRLRDKPELLKELLPDYPPLCKRLTPGPGYLEAFTSPKVNMITKPIVFADETGITASCGTHRPVDVIVCATGFHIGGFPILGRDGVNLWEKYDQRAGTYLGLATDGFSNVPIHTYLAKVISRIAYDNIGLVKPQLSEVERFTNYCETYFDRTVYSADCTNWYKSSPPEASLEGRKRGRVTTLWPGSSLHCLEALEKVRSYDGNAFGWFGNSWTVAKQEQIDAAVLTSYLDTTNFVDNVDYTE
ncbi:hypothetical protein BDW75DRAFT_247344 [Aspergillus navahoensis]